MFKLVAVLGLALPMAVSADAYGGGVPAPIQQVTSQPRQFLRQDPFQVAPQRAFQQDFQQQQPRFIQQGFVPQQLSPQMLSFQRQGQQIQYPFEIYQRQQQQQPITNLGFGASSYGVPPQPQTVPTGFLIAQEPTIINGGSFPHEFPTAATPSVLSSVNEPTVTVPSSSAGSAGSAYGPPAAIAQRSSIPTPSPRLHINSLSNDDENDSDEHGFRRSWRHLVHRKIRA